MFILALARVSTQASTTSSEKNLMKYKLDEWAVRWPAELKVL